MIAGFKLINYEICDPAGVLFGLLRTLFICHKVL
jgi:hypothetical protein